MIAALDEFHIHGGRQRAEDGLDFLPRAKCIPRALHEQDRHADPRQVRGAELCGPARRMERIPEQHEAGKPIAPGFRGRRSGHVRGHPPAHRLAADHHRPCGRKAIAHERRHGAPRRLEQRGSIG